MLRHLHKAGLFLFRLYRVLKLSAIFCAVIVSFLPLEAFLVGDLIGISIGIFTLECYFLKGKARAMGKKIHIGVKARHFSSFEGKNLFCFSWACLSLQAFLKPKNIPQTALRPKQWGCSKKSFFFFLMTNMWVHFS